MFLLNLLNVPLAFVAAIIIAYGAWHHDWPTIIWGFVYLTVVLVVDTFTDTLDSVWGKTAGWWIAGAIYTITFAVMAWALWF